MARRVELRLAVHYVLIILVLGGASLATHHNFSRALDVARDVEQSYRVRLGLEHALSLIKDAETGQRGYLLTGREAYLEPFDRASRGIDAELRAAEALLGGDREARAALASLRRDIDAKLAELGDTIARRRAGGLEAALPVVLTDRGKRLMDAIREQVRGLERREQAAAGRLLGGDEGLGDRVARGGTVVGACGALALLLLSLHLVRHELAARERAEADLARVAAIVGSTDDAIIGKSLDGVITSWNAGAERLYGYTAAEAIGRHLDLILPEGQRDPSGELLERVARGEHPGQFEAIRRRRDGTTVEVELRVSPVRDEAGAIVGAATIARDLTERRRAEALLLRRTAELEEAQRWLASGARFAEALNQPGMRETYRAALGRLAAESGAALAALYDVVDDGPPRCACAVGPDLKPMEAAALGGAGLPAAVARSGEPAALDGPFDDPSLRVRCGIGAFPLAAIRGWPLRFRGRTLGVLVTGSVAPPDAAQERFVRTALDGLAVRMAGYQVEQQRMELLADLQARSRDLEAARLEAERANRAKSEFLAAMSHELRTPMNSIMGFTARLLRSLGPTLGERELDALQTVDRNAKHLLALINDILDLSKIEAGKMELQAERFDAAALARDVVAQSAALVDGRPVALAAEAGDEPVELEADRRMVKQVLLNLVSNAAKFTDRGRVTVTAATVADPALGPAARLAVRDTGVGIRPEDRPNLFRRFSQLGHDPAHRAGGTGLGLAISERMVRMHGGRIDVTSEPGAGSEFAVLIPLRGRAAPAPRPAAEATRAPGPAPAPDRAGSGVTILCVDDEPDALKYLKLTFEDAGYDTLLAAGRDEAIRLAAGARPDLICLDLTLTEGDDGDGFGVLRSLREDPALADVPVLVVSATSQEARALRAGARRYLPKPAAAEELVAAVRELLAPGAGDVLVVEDEPDARKHAVEALAEGGLRAIGASSGPEALARLAEATPAAIVLDLLMPGMDGFTFLGRLAAEPSWRDVPVVVLTAKALTAEERAWLGRSCAAVLAKGKGEAQRLVDAVLQASLPRARRPREAVPA